MWLVAWCDQFDVQHWEVIDGEDAMQIRVSDLMGDEGIHTVVVGSVVD